MVDWVRTVQREVSSNKSGHCDTPLLYYIWQVDSFVCKGDPTAYDYPEIVSATPNTIPIPWEQLEAVGFVA